MDTTDPPLPDNCVPISSHPAAPAKDWRVLARIEGKKRGRKSVPGTFTAAKKQEFLALYAEGGTVRDCAEKVGVSHATVFKHLRTDPEFAERFRTALESNTDYLEDHLYRLATSKAPGNVIALFGLLKARRPEKWREVSRLEHSGRIDFTRPEDLEAARQRARLRGAEAVN